MGDAAKLGFFENFMLAGVAAGVSKTVAAPIERVKLLVQNQAEMIKQGRLDRPYSGVVDCTKRTMAAEGALSFWRGNLANVLRYFPTQAQLCLQGHHQVYLCHPQDCPPVAEVRHQHCLRWCRWNHVPPLRLLPGLCEDQAGQRCQGQGWRAPDQRPD